MSDLSTCKEGDQTFLTIPDHRRRAAARTDTSCACQSARPGLEDEAQCQSTLRQPMAAVNHFPTVPVTQRSANLRGGKGQNWDLSDFGSVQSHSMRGDLWNRGPDLVIQQFDSEKRKRHGFSWAVTSSHAAAGQCGDTSPARLATSSPPPPCSWRCKGRSAGREPQ
jgi:hypothetical protein